MGCLFLLIIIVGLPVAEIAVMNRVAAQIGFWDTLVLLVLFGVFGTYLAKHQGKVVLARIQQCLAEGRQPSVEMVDGLLIFLGGVLFVFPGFISDILGVLCVFPLTRWVIRWFVLMGFKVHTSGAPRPAPRANGRPVNKPGGIDRGHAVDAEVVE